MFRVPRDPVTPSFDDVEKIGFWRWLGSKSADRREWARRRNAAAQLAKTNQDARAEAWADRKRQEAEDRKQSRQ